jgi:hypothetical protein
LAILRIVINNGMRIIEILLPRGADRSLSSKQVQNIQMLQQRMNSYVDRIMDPKTSLQGKEFLKSRLRDDYYDLKDAMKPLGVDEFAESIDATPVQQYEVIDIVTKKVVGGPYSTRVRARRAADKKDLQYGAIRYRVQPAGGGSTVMEAVHKVPITNEDFDLVKELMERPIPAAIAPIYLNEIFEDDEFTDMMIELEESDPGRDVRPLVVEWFNRVMPDQMHHFGQEVATYKQKTGMYSPVHGYDPDIHKGGSFTGTESSGNAYGRR